MPHYGQVWRQPTVPPLWVSGIHGEHLLVVRDLQAGNTPARILRTTNTPAVDLLAPPSNTDAPDIEPVIYDRDDEDYDIEASEDSMENGDDGGWEHDSLRDSRADEDDWTDDEGGFGEAYSDFSEEDAHLELEGERKMGQLRTLHADLICLAQAVESELNNPHLSLMPERRNPAAMM